MTAGPLLGERGQVTRTPHDERSVEQKCVRAIKATPGMVCAMIHG